MGYFFVGLFYSFMLTSSLSNITSHIKACLGSGLVPFIQSSPGMGKSSIVRSIANDYSLQLIDHRLSTSAPEDFTGIPQFKGDKATFIPFDLFPLANDSLPQGKKGWLLFLDEFNSAPRNIQAAAYKLILDRQIGQHQLHENVYIVCAGNKATDKAITTELSTAMTSRLVHLTLEVSAKDWINKVAIPLGFSNEVIAYISAFPERLVDFDPNKNTQEKTFCCPRTWEFVDRLVQSVGTHEDYLPVYCGAISSGVALEFIQYCKVFNELPTRESIIANPMTTSIPEDKPKCYALIVSLAQHAERNAPENVSVFKFIDRLSTDLRILFYRMLVLKDKDWLKSDSFMKQVQDIVRHFND